MCSYVKANCWLWGTIHLLLIYTCIVKQNFHRISQLIFKTRAQGSWIVHRIGAGRVKKLAYSPNSGCMVRCLGVFKVKFNVLLETKMTPKLKIWDEVDIKSGMLKDWCFIFFKVARDEINNVSILLLFSFGKFALIHVSISV